MDGLYRTWHHPWLRVRLLLWAFLATRWDAEAWRQVGLVTPKAFAERDRTLRALLN